MVVATDIDVAVFEYFVDESTIFKPIGGCKVYAMIKHEGARFGYDFMLKFGNQIIHPGTDPQEVIREVTFTRIHIDDPDGAKVWQRLLESRRDKYVELNEASGWSKRIRDGETIEHAPSVNPESLALFSYNARELCRPISEYIELFDL